MLKIKEWILREELFKRIDGLIPTNLVAAPFIIKKIKAKIDKDLNISDKKISALRVLIGHIEKRNFDEYFN